MCIRDSHVTSFQKPDEGIPVFVRTVLKTRTFHIVVFDDIDLDRELAAIEGQSFCIFEAVVDIFQKQILESRTGSDVYKRQIQDYIYNK